MFAHEALRLTLIADATVTALVGERIFPGVLTQTVTFPAVAYRKVDAEAVERLESRGHSGLTLFRYRFFSTCDVASGGFDTANDVAEAVRLCLQGFSGNVIDPASSPQESLHINGIFQRFSLDGYDDQTQTYQVIADYDVWAREQQPEDDDFGHILEDGEEHVLE